MEYDGLYEKAKQLRAQVCATEERERRLAEVQHLVIGVDKDGRLYFVSDDGELRQDIREAAVFTQNGLEQAVAIANQTDLEQRHRCAQLAVITMTAGDLERLTLEQTSSP